MELNRWKRKKIHMTTFISTPNFLKYLMMKQRRREKKKGKYSNTNNGFDGAA